VQRAVAAASAATITVRFIIGFLPGGPYDFVSLAIFLLLLKISLVAETRGRQPFFRTKFQVFSPEFSQFRTEPPAICIKDIVSKQIRRGKFLRPSDVSLS
jgi:hypothetical protein